MFLEKALQGRSPGRQNLEFARYRLAGPDLQSGQWASIEPRSRKGSLFELEWCRFNYALFAIRLSRGRFIWRKALRSRSKKRHRSSYRHSGKPYAFHGPRML